MQAAASIVEHSDILTQSVRRCKRPPGESPRLRPLTPTIRAALGTSECERLVSLAAFLPDPERAIVLELLREGRSMVHVARLGGIPLTTLRRRVRAILLRLHSPAFAFVVARRLAAAAATATPRAGRHDRDDPIAHATRAWPPEWSRTRRLAAELCILRGLSARRAAAASGEPLRVLLRQVQALRELAAEWQATTRRPARPRHAEDPR